MMNNRKI